MNTALARPERAWMRLPSGRRLDLINPDPNAWTDEDLAVRLARTYRWGGESCWPRPLSVAQHSLCVLALAEQAAAVSPVQGNLDAPRRLRELLHDAEEAFLGFDCISPLKRALGAPFLQVSERLMAAVQTRYALPAWTEEEHAAHKAVDLAAAAAEALHCVGWSSPEIRDVLRIDAAILEVDPLVARYGCAPWEPWSANLAAQHFLEMLHALRANGAPTPTP